MKFKAHNYQAFCVKRIITTPQLALWLDMGLGKTVITLTAVNDLKYNRLEVMKVLVIAPKTVAETTWLGESRKWDHLKHLRISSVLGGQQKRIRAISTPADIYVINRENVKWLVDYCRNDWSFDMVVIDESSSFKSHQSQRFKALKAIRPKIKRIVELTGTPSPNSLIDLWAQVYLLDGGQRLGKGIGQFRERYFNPDQRDAQRVFSYKPKDGAEQAVKQLLADICVSMKAEDYLDLPECTTIDIPVKLDAKARKAYDEMAKSMVLQVPEGQIDVTSAAALSNKLLQLASGAIYNEEHEAIHIHDCKIDAFMDLVEGLNGQHALVFYNFQHDRDRILKALSKSGLSVRVYQGPDEEQDWNNGKIDILLAHPASTAYGLNLQQGGHYVIWFTPNWSLELYKQANARLHRQGQQERVIIYQLVVGDTRDEDVIKALADKDTTQESLLQSLKARIDQIKKGT